MIVVAIIGILAAIAIPQYQDYVTRARWADNIASIASTKIAIGQCLQENSGDMTKCATAALLNTAVGYPSLPVPKNGTVAWDGTVPALTITGSGQLTACVVTFTPVTTDPTQIKWTGATSGNGCTKQQTGV